MPGAPGALMQDAGQPLASLGAHIGSNIDSLEPFAELALRLAAAEAQATAAGLPPERDSAWVGDSPARTPGAWPTRCAPPSRIPPG